MEKAAPAHFFSHPGHANDQPVFFFFLSTQQAAVCLRLSVPPYILVLLGIFITKARHAFSLFHHSLLFRHAHFPVII